MAHLKTKNGIEFIVDDADVNHVSKYTWYINKGGYVVNTMGIYTDKINRYLHRFLLAEKLVLTSKQFVVDHINQNKLDNRRSNLRIVDHTINGLNSKKSKGCYFSKHHKKWISRIMLNRKTYILGRFKEEELALKIYKEARDFIVNGGTLAGFLNSRSS